MMLRFLTVIIVSACLAVTAQAALLTNIQGAVSVNRGEGFKRVTQPTQVQPGDRVLVGDSGQAQILYENGSIVPVNSNQALLVQAQAPVDASATGAGGGLGATTLVVGGVIIVAGGVGLAALANSGGSKNPASPASP